MFIPVLRRQVGPKVHQRVGFTVNVFQKIVKIDEKSLSVPLECPVEILSHLTLRRFGVNLGGTWSFTAQTDTGKLTPTSKSAEAAVRPFSTVVMSCSTSSSLENLPRVSSPANFKAVSRTAVQVLDDVLHVNHMSPMNMTIQAYFSRHLMSPSSGIGEPSSIDEQTLTTNPIQRSMSDI